MSGEIFRRTLAALGFGHKTGVDLPAENPGRLLPSGTMARCRPRFGSWLRHLRHPASIGYSLRGDRQRGPQVHPHIGRELSTVIRGPCSQSPTGTGHLRLHLGHRSRMAAAGCGRPARDGTPGRSSRLFRRWKPDRPKNWSTAVMTRGAIWPPLLVLLRLRIRGFS